MLLPLCEGEWSYTELMLLDDFRLCVRGFKSVELEVVGLRATSGVRKDEGVIVLSWSRELAEIDASTACFSHLRDRKDDLLDGFFCG